MNDLGLVLEASPSALTPPSKVQVAQVLSASDFARPAGVTTTGAPGGPASPGGNSPAPVAPT